MSESRRLRVSFPVLLAALLCGLAPDAGAQGSAAADRAALEALYHAAGGSNWTNSSHWLDDAAPLGEWHGVSTDGQGRVTTLDLRENGLTGAVPDALGDLASLTTLDLRENGLTGTVPAALADLASLEELLLARNGLSGPIPTALGNLASLRRLVLARNFLAGPIPHGLGRLSRLEELGLNDNDLTGPIPTALGALVRLEELDLGGNALSGSIPGELESLQRLESLYVWGNPLTGPLPRRLTRLGRLAALEMHDTQLCVPDDAGFRDWVGSIAEFTGRYCDAAGTPFTGPTPMSGAGPVQAVHLTELREYADSLRLRCRLELFRWTDAVIVRGVTPVRAVHVNDLRRALTEAFEACEATPPPWSAPAPAPGAPVRAGHFAELREAVAAGPGSGGGPFDLSTVEWLHHDVSDWPETSTITGVEIDDDTSGRICIEHTKRRDWPGVRGVVSVVVAGNPWVFAQVDGQWYAATYEWLRPRQECKLVGKTPSRELGPHIKRPPLDRWVPQPGERVGFMVSTPARTGPRGPLQERSNIEFVVWP